MDSDGLDPSLNKFYKLLTMKSNLLITHNCRRVVLASREMQETQSQISGLIIGYRMVMPVALVWVRHWH
jgi:hypothetical protein